jgi:hypothetical protein
MTNRSTRVPASCHRRHARPAVLMTRGLRSGSQSVMFVGDLRQRQAVVDVKQAPYARIAKTTCVRTRCYHTKRPELFGPASSKPTNTMARLKGKVDFRKGPRHGR